MDLNKIFKDIYVIMKKRASFLVIMLLACLCVMAQPPRFLTTETQPNSLKFLQTPPSTIDRLFYNDWSQYEWGKSVRNSEAGALAAYDAHHGAWYNLCEVFADQFGLQVTEKDTPAIYEVMSRSVTDAHQVNKYAKKYYRRTRPFVQFNEPSLVPEKEEEERTDFSYPSGHAARGWMVAFILSEINPEATADIFARAVTFGQGRVIAGYHYQSDVEASRLVAMATFIALHGNAEFCAKMAAAKAEYARLKREMQ